MIYLFDRFKSIAKNCKGFTLDLGSAEGKLHGYLKKEKQIRKLIGADIIKNENVDLIHDLNKFPYPFKTNTFDSVVAGEIIEHLKEPYQFLKEVKHILKKRGRLILTTPNSQMFFYRTWKHPQHKYCWDIFTLKRLLLSVGFKIKESGFTNDPKRPFYSKILVKIFPKKSWFLIFICEK